MKGVSITLLITSSAIELQVNERHTRISEIRVGQAAACPDDVRILSCYRRDYTAFAAKHLEDSLYLDSMSTCSFGVFQQLNGDRFGTTFCV